MSDNESEQSLPEVLSRAQMAEFDEGNLLKRNRDFENDKIERRFSDMSRQISELTNIVLSLTERLSSKTREGNGLNTLSSEPNGRSDTRLATIEKDLFLLPLQQVVNLCSCY